MKKYILLIVTIIAFLNLNAQKQKVIFDCDLGGDIDDAFAVALLLCSLEEFEILGLCMDHGHTPGRAKIACKMLYETGMENIPVYVGPHTPGIVGEHTELAGEDCQVLWADDFDLLLPQKQSAVDFMIDALNKYPGEIILFTVGPVDNIGAMLDKDPDILKKAKKVVSMFGSIEKGYGGGKPEAEWNVRGSIVAGKKLMESGADIVLAPLDVTDHVIFDDKYLNALAMRKTPLTDAVASLYSLWYRHADWATTPKMFDGVAIGMVLWPELFTTKKAFIYVDEKGFTRVDKNKKPNCTVGITIKDKEFIQRMAQKILRQNFRRNNN